MLNRFLILINEVNISFSHIFHSNRLNLFNNNIKLTLYNLLYNSTRIKKSVLNLPSKENLDDLKINSYYIQILS